MLRTSTLIGAAAAGLLLGGAACHNDELFRSAATTPVDPVFARYVSLGNSITAGFQSGGINDSTQWQSYANLLASQMRTPFTIPLLNRPGCPPPLVNIFTRTVVGPPLPPQLPCALRKRQSIIAPFLNNVAVPGAAVEDILSNLSPASNPNTLTTILLGGQTQTQAMLRANPTFVTVWIGNNDVLGAATDTANGGDPAQVTAPADFSARYDSVLDAIDATPASGKGVLLGAVDVAGAPFFSYGHIYFGAKLAGALPATFIVMPSCAPQSFGGIGDTTLVPFRYGFGLIAAAQAGAVDTLDCLNDHNITPGELANLHAAVAGYNAHISSEATARGYAYFDPNAALAALRADTNLVAVFPHPPPDPRATATPFGSAVSRDGVHPSAATHKLIANALIQVINAKYQTSLQPIP
ncbi:MAG TPA: SGNH/GDSL hydrolase family protein [Gemmatimonadales bacterium]|nr:SGNH/GDSL hydrolase family protein [Gemmatimonadales bacterium]